MFDSATLQIEMHLCGLINDEGKFVYVLYLVPLHEDVSLT
jgi:hypothetical protein